MPLYGVSPPIGLSPGQQMVLFAGESLTAPQASQVFSRGPSPSLSDQGITFFMQFASSPTRSLLILGSNKLPAATFTSGDWITLATSSNKQVDSYTDTTRYTFYCAYLASQSGGGALTVNAQR